MASGKKRTVEKNQYHVFDPYRGKPSKEGYIPTGTYLEDDPRLCGCGDHLVAIGHATVTVVDVVEDSVAEPKAPDAAEGEGDVSEVPPEVKANPGEGAVMGSESAPSATKSVGNPPTPKK